MIRSPPDNLLLQRKTKQIKKEKEMAKESFKPGQIVPVSGQYLDKSTGTETTCVKGEKFPPTSRANSGFDLVDQTRHKPPKAKNK